MHNYYTRLPHFHNDLRTYSVVVTTPPAVEPVVPLDLRAHCRVDDDPTYLNNLETACREMFEEVTRLTLINTVYTAYYDRFPECGGALVLPKRPAVTVASITYYDEAGTLQTLDPANYMVDSARLFGRVVPTPALATGQLPWPATQAHRPNAVVVQFTAGHGTTAAAVPMRYRLAIQQHVEQLYGERAAASAVKYEAVPYAYQAIVDQARTREI